MKSQCRILLIASLVLLGAIVTQVAPVTGSAGSPDEDILAVKAKPTPLPATLQLALQDEAGLPPPGTSGPGGVSVPIELRRPDGVLMAEGLTSSLGQATLSVPPGEYVLRYGGPAPGGGLPLTVPLSTKPLWLNGGRNPLVLVVPRITTHVYEDGGPFEFDYLDLDTRSEGLQRLVTVDAGSLVTVESAWWELSTINSPVWFVSLFGEWQPTQALANVKSGCASPSANQYHQERATFRAALKPGVYRLRLVGVLDYTWPPRFYTGHHYSPTMGRDMGVAVLGKGNGVDWGEATLIVRSGIEELIAEVQALKVPARVQRQLITPLSNAQVALAAGNVDAAKAYLQTFVTGGFTNRIRWGVGEAISPPHLG